VFSANLTEFANQTNLEPITGFTVEIPESNSALNPDDDRWLHIAIQSNREEGQVLSINFIDLSQEPDHEYVELVNLSDDAVDLSGWTLAVQNHPLGIGPMTIPAGTTIAPKGMLLLGTNKFDFAFDQALFDPGIGFFENGIGLANGLSAGLGIFESISVPKIDFDALDATQGSEFLATGGADYVDRDGDGAVETGTADNTYVSTIDPPAVEAIIGTAGTKPWDRIVQLEIPDLIPQQPQVDFTAQDIGRIVLGGGIFPNRPEFDNVDNDGDAAILIADEIDNDGDGNIDEFEEGLNEGRFSREERQRWDFGVVGALQLPVPGAYDAETVRYLTTFFDFDPIGGLSPIPAYW